MPTVTTLTVEDLDLIIKDEMPVLPNTFCVLTFETYRKYANNPVIDVDSQSINYLKTINSLNEKISGTIIPKFVDEIESFENTFLQLYKLNDFDVDYNYIGRSQPKSLKWLINRENSKLILSMTPYADASSYDYTALFRESEIKG